MPLQGARRRASKLDTQDLCIDLGRGQCLASLVALSAVVPPKAPDKSNQRQRNQWPTQKPGHVTPRQAPAAGTCYAQVGPSSRNMLRTGWPQKPGHVTNARGDPVPEATMSCMRQLQGIFTTS